MVKSITIEKKTVELYESYYKYEYHQHLTSDDELNNFFLRFENHLCGI